MLHPIADTQGASAVPHQWRKRAPGGRRRWLAVFAWQANPYRVEVDLPRGAVEILPPRAPGERSTLVPAAGRRLIEVPHHGVRLFRWDARLGAGGAEALRSPG